MQKQTLTVALCLLQFLLSVSVLAGCTDDHYGERCASPCPSTCPRPSPGRMCDVTSGDCTQPCPPGKLGGWCHLDCFQRAFGQNCTHRCNADCEYDATSGRYCHAVTGVCLGLCSLGKRGVYCDQVCGPGTYGKGNSTGCPKYCGNCEGDSCQATNGECTSRCKPGWQPTVCKIACQSGRFGQDCQYTCGKCKDSTCNHVDGHCNGVCQAGWKGSRCDTPCDKGTFGQGDGARCPHDCGHCKDGECSAVDGRCTKGCEPGWKIPYCKTPCDDGTFGDCSKQCACRNSSEVCDKSTGMCQSGCRDGSTGEDCQQDCADGYFGNCKTPCRCKDRWEKCDKMTGKCTSGCPDGKRGDNCYECQAGRYGTDCENTCHCRDGNETCDPASGACKSGCPTGWRNSNCQDKCEDGKHGDNCAISCEKTCANSSCHHETGHCALGCVEGFEGNDCTTESSSVSVPGAIGGSLALVAALFLIVLVFCFRRRRKKGKPADDVCEEAVPSRRLSALAGVSNHNHDNVVEENEGAVVMEAMYSNAAPPARPSRVVPVSDLAKGVATWRSDGRFSTEFQSLPQGLTEPHSAAYSAENKGKNRYANICAYDHSRVKLSVPPGGGQTDYINACFVDGYRSPRQFIASQGPTDIILNDFVRMLLEHDVSTVVMLTNLYEDGKVKCNQYWPEFTEATFGGITMAMTSVVTRRDYVIRDLTLSTKGGQRRVSLRHFHFLSWPDKGVPASPWPLLDFRDVAMENAPAGRPVVVHCSAGIGRTGTFIAMDVLLRQAQAEASIDVLQCVTALRQARTQMVQTVEQYGFLHEAVLLGLCAAESALPNHVFLQRYPSFMSPPASSKSPVGREFQKLSQCPFDISDEEVAMGKQPENKDKNVDPKILPVAGARVQLMTSIPDSNGYINAIFISDYEGRDKFILTQTPAANTVREFWAMVADFNVTAIVTLDSSSDKAYWPEKEADFGPTKVQALPPTDMEHFLVSSATVSRDGSSISVKRFQLKKMADSLKAKSDPKPLVTLREEVDKAKAEGRVLVHSRNGAGLGGLYCVLSVLLRRAIGDGVVALPYSLSLVKRLRPQTVESQNEYEFLYVAAKYHLDHHQPSPSDVTAEDDDGENIYANEEPEAMYGNA